MNVNRLAQRLIDTLRAGLDARSVTRTGHLERPRRVDGVELIGRYADSGLKDPPFIVRRADGQVVQLSRLLYLVLAGVDGRRDLEQIASTVSQSFGRRVSADNVAFLVDTKLRPAGLICSTEGAPVTHARRADPLLALRYRAAVIPPPAVRAAARVLRPLFAPFAVGAALSWLIALDLWLAHHGLGTGARQLIAHPVLLLALLGLVIVSAGWHELGHATACTYSGATPGAMGVGLYVIWPAFYTDVTDAYRLRRPGRLRTDLGGVYFNALFALAAGGAYFATHFEALLALVAVQHFQIIQQLTPLMRLDGYYVITDLVGVPDILSRLNALLLSFVPFRAPDPRISELKPWVRAVTTAYIVLFIAALVTLLVLLGLNAPRLVPAAVHSAELYSHRAAAAWHRHDLAAAALAEIQVLTVMLPAVGLALGVGRLLRRLLRHMTRSIDRRLRLALGMTVAALVGFGWPFLLWGLRPPAQTHAARASAERARPDHASPTRHRLRARPRNRSPARTSKALPARVSPPSPSTSATTASAPGTSSQARAPAGTTSPIPSTATSTRAPAASAPSPPRTMSSGTSPAATTTSATTPASRGTTSSTTGGTSISPTTTTNAGTPTTTTNAGTPTTTIPGTTSQTTTGTTTTPTNQTSTSTPSG